MNKNNSDVNTLVDDIKFDDINVNKSSGGPEHPPVTPIPPSITIIPDDQKMSYKSPYDHEKELLLKHEKTIGKQIVKFRKEQLLRLFGASQLVTAKGERITGVIALTTSAFKQIGMKQGEQPYVLSTTSVEPLYEVWGFYDVKNTDSFGHLLSLRPDCVSCVISLRSGYDVADDSN